MMYTSRFIWNYIISQVKPLRSRMRMSRKIGSASLAVPWVHVLVTEELSDVSPDGFRIIKQFSLSKFSLRKLNQVVQSI
jgi:hypothetical protein